MRTHEILHTLMTKYPVRGKPITPNRLASETSIPRSTIHRILSGEVTDIRTRNLEKLAKFFGVSVEELRGDTPLRDLSKVDRPRANPGPGDDAYSSGEPRHLIHVSMQELEMLTCFRSSNSTGRTAIAATVKAISETSPAAAGKVVPIHRR